MSAPGAGRPDEPAPAWQRLAPILAAAVLAVAYVIVSPPSLDLAAHLFRAKLFSIEGFGLWDNYWYAGHHTPGYSVLFPPLAALLTPQVVGALSAVATAARVRAAGPPALRPPGLAGHAVVRGRDRGRPLHRPAHLRLRAAARGGHRARPAAPARPHRRRARRAHRPGQPGGGAVRRPGGGGLRGGAPGRRATRQSRARAAGASRRRRSLPVLILTVLFPEGGSEPFTFATLWPIPLIAVVALIALPRRDSALRAGIVLYVARLPARLCDHVPGGQQRRPAGPAAGRPDRGAHLVAQARARCCSPSRCPPSTSSGRRPCATPAPPGGIRAPRPATTSRVLRFLARQGGGPFRIEIPFTRFHGEAYYIAPAFPLARGWERQLDIKDNTLFYSTPLTAQTYYAWLRSAGHPLRGRVQGPGRLLGQGARSRS